MYGLFLVDNIADLTSGICCTYASSCCNILSNAFVKVITNRTICCRVTFGAADPVANTTPLHEESEEEEEEEEGEEEEGDGSSASRTPPEV